MTLARTSTITFGKLRSLGAIAADQLAVKLIDGKTYYANFQFKK
jgi:hypothetical protein